MQLISKDEAQIENIIGEVVYGSNNVAVLAIDSALNQRVESMIESDNVGFFSFHHEDKFFKIECIRYTKKIGDIEILQIDLF